MYLRRIKIQNVRSFLAPAELLLEGHISIVIGPNGGGKTNLLDIAVVMLRRHLFASRIAIHSPIEGHPDRFEFRQNDALNNMQFDLHTKSTGQQQFVEVDIEVTDQDCLSMRMMKAQAAELTEKSKLKYMNVPLAEASTWNVDLIKPGDRFTYRWANNSVTSAAGPAAEFHRFLNLFEMDTHLRSEYELTPLSMPMIYLPVTRSSNAFQSSVELAGYNDYDHKRQTDSALSRSSSSIVPLAVGRLAQKYRLLLERDNGRAQKEFQADSGNKQLTEQLRTLGYEWELVATNPLKNTYDIRLKKQGTSFLVGAASSGERELLTYLFAIFALNVRNALIVVDEPELHLHPTWQKNLLRLFERLHKTTGNQFLFATHSPTFISPESIFYVSRVFSRNQQSEILKLATAQLPNAKHLLHIVNSQNNESIFFADQVLLVEGASDRMVLEAVLNRFGRGHTYPYSLEVISVGGKGLFPAYEKLLAACAVKTSVLADRDYIEQIGSPELRNLFVVDAAGIKKDVIENPRSRDGDALVQAIDEATRSGSWESASDVWEYIKGRRRRLRSDLKPEEWAMFEKFVDEQRDKDIFLLKKGAIEEYLPERCRGKDLEHLIAFLAESNFWEQMPAGAREELEEIAKRLMP